MLLVEFYLDGDGVVVSGKFVPECLAFLVTQVADVVFGVLHLHIFVLEDDSLIECQG
jgi:hypothetical protein